MNIAIIFSGQLRWFDLSHKSFSKNIRPVLANHNVQFFGNFWGAPGEADITRLEEFKQIYNPITISLDNSKSIEDIKRYFDITNVDNLSNNILFQLYSLHKSFLLIGDNRFDLYLKLRTDLAYLDQLDINFEINTVYVKPTGYFFHQHVNDFLFITRSYKCLKQITEIGFYLDDIINEFQNKNKLPGEHEGGEGSKAVYFNEEILAEYYSLNKVKLESISARIDLARHIKDTEL